jgi:hypothetical protein
MLPFTIGRLVKKTPMFDAIRKAGFVGGRPAFVGRDDSGVPLNWQVLVAVARG